MPCAFLPVSVIDVLEESIACGRRQVAKRLFQPSNTNLEFDHAEHGYS